MNYQENNNELTYAMLRKSSGEIKDRALDFMESGAVMVFPKNYNFISNLPKPFIKSLIWHGWEIDKTVFLEIPYVVTFTQDLDPSLAQVWLTCIPSRKSIFRAVAFSKGYIANAHKIELEDTIIHEQIHIREDEPKLLKGLSMAMSINYEQNEERVEQAVKDTLLKKYGSAVYVADKNALLMAFETQRKLKTISAGYLEYWLHLYFTDKFDVYKDYTIKMDEDLTSQDYLNDIESMYNKVSKVYKDEYNFELKPLTR